jgi:DNA polymerase-3 subunit epsilon
MAANHAAFREVDMEARLTDCRFAVIDLEMTGLDPGRDEIVSLGGVHLDGLSIKADDTFRATVRPEGGLKKASTLVHRITPQQVESMPGLEEVLPDFVEFLDGRFVVGHHVGLDMNFLRRACRKLFGASPANPCLDTLRMAMIHREEAFKADYYDRFDGRVSYALADLAESYGLPRFPEHDALADAMQCAYLFLFLVRKLKDGGIETLRDLFEAGRSWRWYF